MPERIFDGHICWLLSDEGLHRGEVPIRRDVLESSRYRRECPSQRMTRARHRSDLDRHDPVGRDDDRKRLFALFRVHRQRSVRKSKSVVLIIHGDDATHNVDVANGQGRGHCNNGPDGRLSWVSHDQP